MGQIGLLMTPTPDIHLVSEAEKSQLWRELQDYLAELSRVSGKPLADEFPYRHFDLYWQEPKRWPFWIRLQGRKAGFALVRRGQGGVFDMAEFYVRPEHRRNGIGTASARALFLRFPGRWHVSELAENLPAIAFWRRVLDGFVSYREMANADHVDQTFEMLHGKNA
jgi:predicted acetyltransferase